MSVVDYTAKFNTLGTYAPTVMADEALKMHRFKKGLNSRIQTTLAIFQPTNFADLMGAAIRAKTDIRRREGEFKNKRPFSGQSSQGSQKSKKPSHQGGPPNPRPYQGFKRSNLANLSPATLWRVQKDEW